MSDKVIKNVKLAHILCVCVCVSVLCWHGSRSSSLYALLSMTNILPQLSKERRSTHKHSSTDENTHTHTQTSIIQPLVCSFASPHSALLPPSVKVPVRETLGGEK